MKYSFLFFIIFTIFIGHVIPSALQDLELDDNCSKENKSIFNTIANFGVGILKFFKPANPRKDVKFYLYTRQNPTVRQELVLWNRQSILNSNYNSSLPTRIIIHGFGSAAGVCPNVLIRNAYLRKGNFNVIVVDWSIMSTSIYLMSATATKDTGKVIAEFTEFLNLEFDVSFDSIYLIGYSLGAHVAGFAGKAIKPNLYNTIFALDPAGPWFETLLRKDVVNAGDAFYVESIQTNIKLFGFNGQLGNASVYPAYGNSKEGHSGAYVYFAQSINEPDKFEAKPCDNFQNILNRSCVCKMRNDCYMRAIMGGEPSYKKNGIYYVNAP